MKITWFEEAWEELILVSKTDKPTFKKISSIIKDVSRNGVTGAEPLKYEMSGWYSRRVNKKDRFVFRVHSDTIEILAIRNHYGDK